MFFIISHELSPKKMLRGISANNGHFYFRAMDVAKMLGAADPKKYVMRVARKRVADIMKDFPNIMSKHLPGWLQKMRVFNLDETVHYLGMKASGTFANMMAQRLEKCGSSTRCLRNLLKEEPSFDWRTAPRVIITRLRDDDWELMEGSLAVDRLDAFLYSYRKTCELFYHHEEKACKEERIRRMEWLVKVPSSLRDQHEEIFVDSPPRILNLQIGNNSSTHTYVLV